jgi:hypothetical protein
MTPGSFDTRQIRAPAISHLIWLFFSTLQKKSTLNHMNPSRSAHYPIPMLRPACLPWIACIFLCSCLGLSSCLGPAKIDKWVAHEYKDVPLTPDRKKASDYISIKDTFPSMDQRYSTTEDKSGSLLPLIFYWHKNYIFPCTLNPQLSVNNFTSSFMAFASSRRLKQHLNGRRVEISISSIPHSFTLGDNDHMIWLIYAYEWSYIDLKPGTDDLVLSYRILQGSDEVKTGTISIPDANRRVQLKMFQSLRKMTYNYLDQFNENITAMSKKAVDQLISEL